jgi:hypothetical protein
MVKIKISQWQYNNLERAGAKKNDLNNFEIDPDMNSVKSDFYVVDVKTPWDDERHIKLKQEFNTALKSFDDAIAWFESPERKLTDFTPSREKAFLDRKDKLGEIMKQIEKEGIKYSV